MKCCICGKVFLTKKELREHIKTRHPEIIQRILSQLSSSKRKRIKNPENWAAGYFIAYSCS